MRSVPKALASLVVGVTTLVITQPSAGADAGAEDPDSLVRAIAQEAETLSIEDCTAACNALASMRRATERLCELDAGRRCEDARATLERAARKVRAACPTCVIATGPELEKRDRVETAAVPPAGEGKAGGCAGCRASRADHGAELAPCALAAALAAVLRRRRR